VAGSIALDSENNVWVADSNNDAPGGYTGNTPTGAITEVSSNGTTEKDFITSGGITNPSHIAIDAGQNVWVSNLHTTSTTTQYESISELAGATSSNPGAALSPSTGYGLDAGLLQPYGLIVDPSGDVWVSNTYANSLVMFFGMATPTKTPMPPTPMAP
jgi:streptogramin lyase